MRISRINSAVLALSKEIASTQSQGEWTNLEEQTLLYELFACILGSRVRFEIALAATDRLATNGLLNLSLDGLSEENYQAVIENVLNKPLQLPSINHETAHYRFAHSRSKYLARTHRTIYYNGSSLRQLLQSCRSANEARKILIDMCTGIGPKQASLFLRNIGFTDDLAILDSHVLRYMWMNDLLVERVRAIGSLFRYQEYEAKLRNYAHHLGWMLGCMDQAIWIVMRVSQREFAL